MPDAQSPPASPTILVVDDEPSIVNLCHAVLEQAGFTILEADGSSEALKICTRHEGPIDLLLTDLILPPPGFHLASGANEFPHVHGYELAVRAARIREGLRIVLMSGNPDTELDSHGIKPGTLPFVQKPFEPAALIQLIRDVLQSPPPTINENRERTANEVDWFD
ncbi:response regulator [Nitrospira sp. NS4]|uniref:response regulator n=1 Tax=Nitrospira sp. NS4 TaxID=3414498 RepID=UPI003C2C2BEC